MPLVTDDLPRVVFEDKIDDKEDRTPLVPNSSPAIRDDQDGIEAGCRPRRITPVEFTRQIALDRGPLDLESRQDPLRLAAEVRRGTGDMADHAGRIIASPGRPRFLAACLRFPPWV